MSSSEVLSHRRTFITSVVTGAAILTAAKVGNATTLLSESGMVADESWVRRIRGRHRQVVDCTSHDDGFGIAYGLNFIDTTKEALKLPDAEFTSVISYRHWAMPLMLSDAIWGKYKIGEVLNITDPKTKAPATRNIYRDNVFGRPGLTYEEVLATKPLIMTACNIAVTVLSGIAGPKVGVSAEQAKAEWTAGLLPGVQLVPSGVYAVHRAQQAGCTYCNGR